MELFYFRCFKRMRRAASRAIGSQAITSDFSSVWKEPKRLFSLSLFSCVAHCSFPSAALATLKQILLISSLATTLLLETGGTDPEPCRLEKYKHLKNREAAFKALRNRYVSPRSFPGAFPAGGLCQGRSGMRCRAASVNCLLFPPPRRN